MSSDNLESLERRLDHVIALLKILASKQIEEKRRIILSTPKKQQIYELCDGTNEMREIAEKADVSGEYVRLTIRDLEDIGFVIVQSKGTKHYPKRVI